MTRIWAMLVVSAAVLLTIFPLGGCARLSLAPTATIASTHPPAVTEETMDVPTALPVVSPTSAEPLLYIVQEGDTLGAIAQTCGVSVEGLIAANDLVNPDALAVGQTLVVPLGGSYTPTDAPSTESPPEPVSTPTPLPTLLPTLTPSVPPLIEIGQVLGSGNVMAEVVVVRNRGGVVSLEGWTLADAQGNIFYFPALVLFTDAEVRVHSTAGSSTPRDLYWGRANPAWNGGELITLRDVAGEVVDTYIAP